MPGDPPGPRNSDATRDTDAPVGAILRREDWELVQATLQNRPPAPTRFAERMACVGRFLTAENRRLGRPFDEHALADLAQDVVVRVWERLGRYRGDAALETWVYRFCDLTLRNALRRLIVRRSTSSLEPAQMVAIAGEDADDGADAERVHRALDALPADEAAVVRLKQFEGRTFDEIGARLGIPANTARSRYYRALVRLRGLLQSDEDAAR